ncbi:Ig-like domain-containing protein [Oceanimonas sp. CHS3-5]|uniref:Ig-like domain-containing protein n=1 Tax=Oceanimonas sp. CHS3-5 TaxID=3068186 RepID=UPI00273D2CF6|nr:Ig-like domain-containing protein [Oceanimonas sp. CHS3-5]MDP5293446.1 Ig-like domain-containing protein [Oceanimonas sp. CHS3-5]
MSFAAVTEEAHDHGIAAKQPPLAAPAENRAGLVALARIHPGKALMLARQARLAQPAEQQGELELRYEHHKDGSSRLRYLLHTQDNEQLELYPAGAVSRLHSGQRVAVRGLALGRESEITDADDHLLLLADDILILGADGGSNGGTAASAGATLGEQRTAVMLVNYENAPNDKPWTRQQAADFMFGPVSNYFMEASYGQTWLTGDALGWYTVPLQGGGCPSGTIDEANRLATQSGVDLSQYDRLVYLVPESSGCNANWGTVGGSPSRAFVTAGLDLQIVAHELGHNLGLRHAHGLHCSDGVLSGSCSRLEYGDTMSIMGDALAHAGPFQKEQLGWIKGVTEITGSGTYTLAPMAAQDGQATGLKILRGLDASGNKQWFYLDHRQPLGADRSLFASSSFGDPQTLASGLLLRLVTEGDADSSHLLDMTPGSVTWAPEFDMMDPALGEGLSFTDADSGLTITPLWADENGLTVDISLGEGGEPESPNQAPVAVNDSASTTENNAVTIDVLTNDWDADGDALSISGADSSRGKVSISNGRLVYTPPAGFSGTEVFGYRITDGRGGEAATSVSVTVQAAPTTPEDPNRAPVANDDSASTSGSAITINVLANDSDPDGDALRIASVTQGGKGSVRINADGTLSYTPAHNFKRGDSFSYTITDGKATASALVSISLSGDGGSSGGKGKGNGKPH